MTPESIIDIFHGTIWVIIVIVGFIILPGLIVGLLVAMFQAATQINEMTLSFIPRLIVTLLALLFAAPWLLKTIIEFSRNLIIDIPTLIG